MCSSIQRRSAGGFHEFVSLLIEIVEKLWSRDLSTYVLRQPSKFGAAQSRVSKTKTEIEQPGKTEIHRVEAAERVVDRF